MSEHTLTIGKIQLADDAQVLDACETELVGWEAAEQAQLAISLNEVSKEAHKLRAVILLMTNEKLDRESAEEKYERLLADSERTIPYIEERIQQLLDDGVITQYEADDYWEYKRLSDADEYDYKNPPIEQKVFDKIQGLLAGMNVNDATRFGKIARDSEKDSDEYERLRLKFLGLDNDEAEAYMAHQKQKEFPVRYKTREEGFTRILAERIQELFDKVDRTVLTPEERKEKNDLIHLRSVGQRARRDLEVRLALRDFGIEKMLKYIALKTKFDDLIITADNIANAASGSVHSPGVAEIAQARIDSIEAEMVYTEEEQARLDELTEELQREPLLRQFVNNYRDVMFESMQRMF